MRTPRLGEVEKCWCVQQTLKDEDFERDLKSELLPKKPRLRINALPSLYQAPPKTILGESAEPGETMERIARSSCDLFAHEVSIRGAVEAAEKETTVRLPLNITIITCLTLTSSQVHSTSVSLSLQSCSSWSINSSQNCRTLMTLE